MSIGNLSTNELLEQLRSYNACDVSDALLKLKVSGSGFLPDLRAICEPHDQGITIALVSTVLFVPKTGDVRNHGESNIPPNKHWADLTTSETIVVVSQTAEQKNAVVGGIMALRMKILGALGIVVHGRVRDIGELSNLGLSIWALSTSTVGAGAEASAHSINVPITIGKTDVCPGDYIMIDPPNGVVVIPREKLAAVLDIIPRLVRADERVKIDIENGMSVQEAFKIHRKGL